MRKFLILVILLASLPTFSHAQFGGVLNKVKSKVKQRADQKVDGEIDKTLDEIEGKKAAPVKEGEQSSTGTTTKKEEEPAFKSFSKYDFIPGDLVLYYDNFEGEAIGELPTGWNTSGTGEVMTLDKYPGNWLRLHKNFIYLSSNQKEFGENYTAEFDVIFRLKNNGWSYPDLRFGFFRE